MKKIVSLLLVMTMLLFVFPVGAADVSRLDEYNSKFTCGVGPVVNDLAIDYMVYSPENIPDGAKVPLVLFFHGLGHGQKAGDQLDEDNIALWASEELQSRFTNGGAYILAPRSPEDKGIHWDNICVESVKAAVDDFIAGHSDTIDIQRIYVGGFSMGGMMTLKMASSYPEFFAASFPMCPAYKPSAEQYELMADMPTWLIVSRYDVIAGYYVNSEEIWNNICKTTNIPADCRLSLFGRVRFPDGKWTTSNHHVWFAQANDLFMYDGSQYPDMVNTDAAGNKITLTYPDGLISWLCSYTSDYDGSVIENNGCCERNNYSSDMISAVLGALVCVVRDMFLDMFGSLFKIGNVC